MENLFEMAEDNTPLWLEIKPEYIDSNIDSVISYLSRNYNKSDNDSFYDETVKLLAARSSEIISGLSDSGIEIFDVADKNGNICKGRNITELRILGSDILVNQNSHYERQKEAFFFFVMILGTMVSERYTDDLSAFAVSSLNKGKVISYGFTFEHLKSVQPEVISELILKETKYDRTADADQSWFEGKGTMRIADGVIEVHDRNRKEATVRHTVASLELLDNMISVQTEPSDKLKEKDSGDIEAMDLFTNSFIKGMDKIIPTPTQTLQEYEIGDIMPVRYTGKDAAGNLLVETVDGDHRKIKGQIQYNEKAYANHYNVMQVAEYLQTGDAFDAELSRIDEAKGRTYFKIDKTFPGSILDMIEQDRGTEYEYVNARYDWENPGNMKWWTENGYPAFVKKSKDCESYHVGDTAIIHITNYNSNGYIYAEIDRPSDEPVDIGESRRFCVEHFIYSEDHEFVSAPKQLRVISPYFVKGLCRMLYNYQKSVNSVIEKFRILCMCRILSRLSDDEESESYLEFNCKYIRNLSYFAKGQTDKISPMSLPSGKAEVQALKTKAGIIDVLLAYGKDSENDRLGSIIASDESGEIISRLAKLVQSCNRIDDFYPSIKNVIKHEITKFLSVNTEDNTDFEEIAGPNFGVENSRQEFKTSFFYAPAYAHEQNQEKTIFKSLCAFLNTYEGGTLYLGVNDGGNISGIQNDLEYIHKNVYGAYSGVDGYVRYITDRARAYFELDVRLRFKIEPIYDSQVVAIHVEPYQNGVVEFEGIAYVRNNSECVKMNLATRRQIEAKKLARKNDDPEILASVKQAISEERKVVFKDYISSSSNSQRDRVVEPFALISNDSIVWCYDMDTRMNKLFRISRIGSVKVLNENWSEKHKHVKGKTDVFNFTENEHIKVRLLLDNTARNLLVDEYPESVSEIRPYNAAPDETYRWLFDTVVYNITGVGRFYVGLVDHIRILEAPGLEEFAGKYFDSAMKTH